MTLRLPAKAFITPIEDSRRWQRVTYRPDDIVVSTPPKSGTTWTQGIVRALLWPDGDVPDPSVSRSVWVDSRIWPIEDMLEMLEGQTHRRCIKTHSPADTIPLDSSVRYLTVYRSAPDALVSWGNHRQKLRPEMIETSNRLASVDGLAPLPAVFDGDYDRLFDEWSTYVSPAIHLASWWPRRNQPNVLMLHYADLLADLPSEMKRIAEFLDIDIADSSWPDLVARCHITSMRERADQDGRMEIGFEGGAGAFFFKGGNGRGRELLSDAQVDRCHRHCAELLSDDAMAWLESGSASGVS